VPTAAVADPRSPSALSADPRCALSDPRRTADPRAAAVAADPRGAPASPASSAAPAASTPPPAASASGASGASLADILKMVQQAGSGDSGGSGSGPGTQQPGSAAQNAAPAAAPGIGSASAALPAGLDLSSISALAAMLGVGGVSTGASPSAKPLQPQPPPVTQHGNHLSCLSSAPAIIPRGPAILRAQHTACIGCFALAGCIASDASCRFCSHVVLVCVRSHVPFAHATTAWQLSWVLTPSHCSRRRRGARPRAGRPTTGSPHGGRTCAASRVRAALPAASASPAHVAPEPALERRDGGASDRAGATRKNAHVPCSSSVRWVQLICHFRRPVHHAGDSYLCNFFALLHQVRLALAWSRGYKQHSTMALHFLLQGRCRRRTSHRDTGRRRRRRSRRR